MNSPYLVRCTADSLGGYIGRFATQTIHSHRAAICSTISEERAARYASQKDAASAARRLSQKFIGTAWEACHVD